MVLVILNNNNVGGEWTPVVKVSLSVDNLPDLFEKENANNGVTATKLLILYYLIPVKVNLFLVIITVL